MLDDDVWLAGLPARSASSVPLILAGRADEAACPRRLKKLLNRPGVILGG